MSEKLKNDIESKNEAIQTEFTKLESKRNSKNNNEVRLDSNGDEIVYEDRRRIFTRIYRDKTMKIPYIILALCLFVYADNFKGITIVELDQPSVNLGRADKESGEYYINAIKETCNTEIVQYFHKANIIKFFKQAKEYDNIPVAQYCTYPCVITGKVKLDSITYDFELNEGGYAVLKGKNEERYFGDEKLYGECGI